MIFDLERVGHETRSMIVLGYRVAAHCYRSPIVQDRKILFSSGRWTTGCNSSRTRKKMADNVIESISPRFERVERVVGRITWVIYRVLGHYPNELWERYSSRWYIIRFERTMCCFIVFDFSLDPFVICISNFQFIVVFTRPNIYSQARTSGTRACKDYIGWCIAGLGIIRINYRRNNGLRWCSRWFERTRSCFID